LSKLIQNNQPLNNNNAELICWKLLLWLQAISIPLIAIVRPRSFEANFIDTIVARAENEWGIDRIVPAIITLALFILCFFIIIMCVSKVRKRLSQHSTLLICFSLGVSLAPLIATILFGDPIQPATFTCFFLLFASFLLHPPETTWFIRNVRISLLIVFIYGSLLSIILAPTWSIQTDYDTSVAILDYRLFGTANHPNELGPFALLTLLLSFFPGAKFRGETLHRISAFVVLFLSQSKTSWLITLFCIAILLYKQWEVISNVILKIIIALTMISIITCGTALGTYYFSYNVINILNDPEVLTLTGRLFLWIYAWGYWLDSPWFGHGYSAWSSDKVIDNLSILNWAAPHAHNQFLQTLTEGGIFAEFLLIGFLTSIFYTIMRNKINGQAIVFLVFILLVSRSITEIILEYRNGSTLFLLWIALTIVISLVGSKNKVLPRYSKKAKDILRY
jgi:O-antigen ligase